MVIVEILYYSVGGFGKQLIFGGWQQFWGNIENEIGLNNRAVHCV